MAAQASGAVIRALHKQSVLSIYRELLRTTAKITDKIERDNALNKTIKTFHERSKELEPDKIWKFISEAEKRLSFLKMTTPRSITRNPQQPSKTFVYKNGVVVEGVSEKKGIKGFHDDRVTSNDWERHWASVKRQKDMGM